MPDVTSTKKRTTEIQRPIFEGAQDWRKNLIKASFRGVEFYYESGDYKTGHRIQSAPSIDSYQVSTIDFGAEPTEWTIHGFYIVTPENNFDYFPQRNALIDAFRQNPNLETNSNKWATGDGKDRYNNNAGWLHHPYWGPILCLVKEVTFSETIAEGGIVRFTVTFVQFGLRDEPTQVDASRVQADGASGNVLAGEEFGKKYSALAPFNESLTDVVQGALSKVQTAFSKIKGAVSSVVNGSINTIGNIYNTIGTVISQPAMMEAYLKSAIDQFKEVVGMGEQVIEDALRGSLTGDDPVVLDGSFVPEDLGKSTIKQILDLADDLIPASFDTPATAQSDNVTTCLILLRFYCFSNAAEILSRMEFGSQQAIYDAMDSFQTACDDFLSDLAAIPGWKDTFEALELMRDGILNLLLQKVADTVRMTEYQIPAGQTNTLALAYDRYENAVRADEIYDGNRPLIRHPGFLPGGQTIEVKDV